MAFDSRRRPLAVLAGIAGAGLLAAAVTVPAAHADTDLSGLSTLTELTVASSDPSTGDPELVTAPFGRPLARPSDVPSGASDATVARAHLEDIAPLFGVDSAASSLRATKSTELADVGPVVRFGQLVEGVPVLGGELVVSLDESGDLLSVAGDTADPIDPTFVVTSATAASTARATAAAKFKAAAPTLRVGTPRKYVYDPTLLGDTGATRSAWRVIVAGANHSPQKLEVYVDALDGHVLNAFGATEALSIAICDGGNSFTGDASYGWCGENMPNLRPRDTNFDGKVTTADALDTVTVGYDRIDTMALSLNTDIDNAYTAIQDTADLYTTLGDLDDSMAGTQDLGDYIGLSDANAGNPTSVTPNARRLAGVVRYCDPPEYFYPYFDYSDAYYFASQMCPYDNAYWADSDMDWTIGDGAYPGGQMFIGSGLADSPDVIGHELTHGVTSATNGLIYYKEPGAINESMSDVFGELTQVYAQPGTDTAWQIGELLDGGAIRSMSSPSAPLYNGGRQPDSMTSSRWDTDVNLSDAGGVHTNSGVGNKAAYLIAHGGTFNGVVVNRLDPTHAWYSTESTEKVAKLYWATQQKLLANSNYRRLGATMYDACLSLVGTNGFVKSDCDGSVLRAVNATKMNHARATVKTNHSSVKYGKTAVITARISDARDTAIGGVGVKLQRRVAGATTWATVGTSATSSAGTRAWSVKPTRSTYYRVVYAGTVTYRPATSAGVLVKLTPTVSKSVSKKKIKFKKSFTVKGKLSPNLSGKTVWLQRYSSGKWRTVKKDKLSGSSAYSLKYKPTSRADLNYRVYLPSATSYSSAVSAKFRITVK